MTDLAPRLPWQERINTGTGRISLVGYLTALALLGGFAEPDVRFGWALRHALPRSVHDAEVELRQSVILVSGLQVPLCGSFIILSLAFAIGIFHSKVKLSFGASAFGLGFLSVYCPHR